MGRRNEYSREQLWEMALQAVESLRGKGSRGPYCAQGARQIGHTLDSLYMVIRNLDDLIVQVNERTLDELFPRMTHSVAGNSQARDAVRTLGHACVGFASEYRECIGAPFACR